ncbi:MAG: YjbQ family protein, partial [Deltaproteobacteria bacterium]
MVITVKTGSRTEMVDITAGIQDAVSASGMSEGLCMVYVPHTTAAVTINESADPSVKRD